MNKQIYLGLAVTGFILPYTQFVSFLLEHGLKVSLIIQQITLYQFSFFAWLDVIVTAVVVIIMIIEEKERIKYRWLPVLATLLIGPSCGLPLYMYLRN